METKSYTLNNTIQLIDISKDYSKFRTMYNITCDNLQDEFEYAIVSQKRLDQKQFNFKKSVGYIEDSFTQVDDRLDSDWYLILKANKDTPCTVMVDITSLDENVLDEESPLEEQYENFEYNPPPPPQRTLIPKRKQTRFNSKPIIHGDSDSESDSESDEPVPKKSTTDKAKIYKYVFIGLICLLLVIGGLWWTGYLYKIPFLSKFKPVVPPTPSVSPQHMIPQPPPPPPPQIQIPRPPHPQPLTAPQPISMYTEPQQYVPDPDFINEMRDLRLN